jgi:uncharacterized protein with GYD domain
MPKYLFQSRYTAEGASGLVREGGTSRQAAAQRAVESLGGHLESFYYAFGGIDAFIIADLPDHAAAVALNLAVAASGAITTETTVLLSPEEVDEATRRSATYRGPGG